MFPYFCYLKKKKKKTRSIILVLYTYCSFSVSVYFYQIFETYFLWKMLSYTHSYNYRILHVPYITNYANTYITIKITRLTLSFYFQRHSNKRIIFNLKVKIL